VAILIVVVAFLYSAVRILREYERGVVFTLGRYTGTKGPGLFLLVPLAQQMVRIDLRVVVDHGLGLAARWTLAAALRARVEEVLAHAETMKDWDAQRKMRGIATTYEKLADVASLRRRRCEIAHTVLKANPERAMAKAAPLLGWDRHYTHCSRFQPSRKWPNAAND
jgi:hypothetical protein